MGEIVIFDWDSSIAMTMTAESALVFEAREAAQLRI